MLTRIPFWSAVLLLLSGCSYSFDSRVTGRLGGPILFTFYDHSSGRPKTDISSFGVSVRTPDHRWKALWWVDEGRRITQPIEYGVTPRGFTTRIPPEKLVSGRVYGAFANDGGGGLSGVTFRFEKNGKMTFPELAD